jgi:hypothetical protein
MRRWHIAAYLPTEATENPYSTALSSLPEHLPLTKIKLLEVLLRALRFHVHEDWHLPSLKLLCWRHGVKSMVFS